MRATESVAMIEDDDGMLHQVREGDLVVGRRVVAITLDHVELERDEVRTTVVTGMALTGEQARAPRSTSRSSGGSGAAGGGSPDAQSILERMRQRRAQQLGQPTPPRQTTE